MHKIKEMLMEELKEFEKKSDLKAGDLETIHKLTDTVKNIDKIEALEESDGYSEAGGWMADGRMYGTYDHGSSYARGRGRGRNAKRDSMGRYSREDGYSMEGGYSGYEGGGSSYARGNRGGQGRSSRRGYSYGGAKEYMVDKLEEMMDMAETEQERKAIEQCMMKIEQA